MQTCMAALVSVCRNAPCPQVLPTYTMFCQRFPRTQPLLAAVSYNYQYWKGKAAHQGSVSMNLPKIQVSVAGNSSSNAVDLRISEPAAVVGNILTERRLEAQTSTMQHMHSAHSESTSFCVGAHTGTPLPSRSIAAIPTQGDLRHP